MKLIYHSKKKKNQDRKIEMMEKNHKHEIGVEMAHHKEVQRNLIKLNEENRELKVKLEVNKKTLISYNTAKLIS